jgi:hypothetical protein
VGAGAQGDLGSFLRGGVLLSLRDELERVRQVVDNYAREYDMVRGERDAQAEQLAVLTAYVRDPAGSTACTDRAAYDPRCGGCDGCITAQVIYGVTGKAVVG